MDDDFVRSCRVGNTKRARELLADPSVDPGACENVALCAAAFSGHTKIVRALLADARVDPSARDDYAVRFAALGGHTEVLRALLADHRVNGRAAVGYAGWSDLLLLAQHERFGIEARRDLYTNYPSLVWQYDTAIAGGLTMAWVAQQQRSWESLAEPVAKRLKAGFICE
jgi:hypothetical protein